MTGTSSLGFLIPSLLLISLSSCYSSRTSRLEELQSLDERVVCQIRFNNGEEQRVIVGPENIVNEKTFECYPCRYDSDSWRVRFSGWPAVYSAGRYWRQETIGEMVQFPQKDIARIWIEEVNWPLTLVSSPLNVPAGVIDFIVDNAEISFDALNDRFDTFSRPPGQRPPGQKKTAQHSPAHDSSSHVNQGELLGLGN